MIFPHKKVSYSTCGNGIKLTLKLTVLWVKIFPPLPLYNNFADGEVLRCAGNRATKKPHWISSAAL
jgi:hypothetical protein